ncbi:MAG: hypothetical protein LBB73_02740 [Dysgonamonadaceae bacterium]|jgi:hypothetical protein|nr:hypothetical protein [Dysgonamonadaceae bacterium]
MTKKTIFLWGLFLMFFGIANINAQVRIGGESLPDSVAVLDLNRSDNEAVEATGGLLLPRVRLKSYTDSTVFGQRPARGLMVYNVNGTDFDRPVKGAYYYDGTKWVSVSLNNEVEFAITSNLKRIWLGRNGELMHKMEATVVPNVSVDWADVSYKWTITTTDYKPVTVDVFDSEGPDLTVDIDILDKVLSQSDRDQIELANFYASYLVSLTVKYRWSEKTQEIATLSIGPGAWVGERRWLKIASTNLGVEEVIPIGEQLTLVHNEESPETVGYLYQWGSAFHRTSRIKAQSRIQEALVESTINPVNGQPLIADLNVFIKAGQSGDWRTWYPEGYSNNNVPLAWRWNVNAGSGETPDPCRKELGGKWRVPTVSDWENIPANNIVTMISSNHRGITISPLQEEPDKIAVFLPETQLFSPSGDVKSTYPEQGNMSFGYWLDDPGSEAAKSAALYKDGAATGLPTVVEKERAHGFNIRCVAD